MNKSIEFKNLSISWPLVLGIFSNMLKLICFLNPWCSSNQTWKCEEFWITMHNLEAGTVQKLQLQVDEDWDRYLPCELYASLKANNLTLWTPMSDNEMHKFLRTKLIYEICNGYKLFSTFFFHKRIKNKHLM